MNEPDPLVLIPFGCAWLALTVSELEEGRRRAHALMPAASQSTTAQNDPVLDAAGMERETGIKASWFLEQARRDAIPHIRAGKYVRFRLEATLSALNGGGHADRHSAARHEALENKASARPRFRGVTTKSPAKGG